VTDFTSGRMARVRDLCRRMRPLIGERADRLFTAYTLENDEGRKQLEFYLEALAAKHLGSGLDSVGDLVPPSPAHADGPYRLGKVMYNGKSVSPFGLREGEWIQHVGVFGRSGAGKTNLGFEIMRQLVQAGKPVLVLDWKRNYRDLLSLPELSGVQVYTLGRDVAPFSFNPLMPPQGTDPRTWLKQLIEVVAHAYCLGNGVLFLLQESVDAVYEEAGVYDGRVQTWPTFRDVLRKAKERNARGRESAWLSSTLRALSSLCFGEMDRTLNQAPQEEQPIVGLLNKSVILEMDALGQADKVFLTSALLLYIHHYRMAEGGRERFKHAILIEEAHHILSNERRSLIGGQSVMEITFREIREFGESVVVLDQHPSKIAISALGNTYCTICLNLKHQKDVNAMAQSMLLEGEEKDLLGRLEVGQAVVKLQGRAPRPFLIQIPEFSVVKGAVTDNAIRLHMAPFLKPSPARASPEPGSNINTQEEQQVSGHGGNEGNGVDPEGAFLRDVAQYPEGGVAARYQRLGVSVRQGQRIKLNLAQKGLVTDHEERTATGRRRVVRLTEKGRILVEKTGNTA
jgi:hypothetical protein